MKRLIVAVAIALSTASALADAGAPFEQTELDRALPALTENAAEHVLVAQIGNMSYKSGEGSESAFANDHNFIAPAR